MSNLSVLASAKRVPRPHSRVQTRRPRILVANDDRNYRRSLQRQLTGLGYDVTEVSDGAQVLEALAWAADGRNGWPDVLVLDLRRSSFAGRDVLSALQGFADMPPTLVVSALGEKSVAVAVSIFSLQPSPPNLELNAVLAAVLAAACKQQADRHRRHGLLARAGGPDAPKNPHALAPRNPGEEPEPSAREKFSHT